MVREETDVPGGPDTPPDQLTQRMPVTVNPSDLRPVARLQTLRHQVDLVDPAEQRLAEVADDRVTVLDPTGHEVSTFREVEVEEVGDPPPGLVDAVVARLREAGARQPEATAKYVRALRALGFAVPTK